MRGAGFEVKNPSGLNGRRVEGEIKSLVPGTVAKRRTPGARGPSPDEQPDEDHGPGSTPSALSRGLLVGPSPAS